MAENTNKEEILADFQSCTGLDDIGECIMCLEASQWNLLDAVNRVMPQETQTLPSEQREQLYQPSTSMSSMNANNDLDNDVKILHSTYGAQDVEVADASVPMDNGPVDESTSVIHLTVNYKDKKISLEIPSSETVATIKTALFAELGIAPCRQQLLGWKNNHVTDESLVSSLKLPPDSSLYLSTTDADNVMDVDMGTSTDGATSQNFELHITDITNNKTYKLNFPGSKTVLDIKQDMFAITDIPVRFQKWYGWPEAISNEYVTLGSIRGMANVHQLMFRRVESPKKSKQVIIDLASSDSSVEEFEDANESIVVDEEFFRGESSARKTQPLMPDGVEDETAAVSHFCNEFANRFGDCHPMFFQGTLNEALQSSCMRPAKQRRPLCVYLHHDGSILANVFCSERLCTESIVTYLTTNFVTWAWDLTFESNKSRFLAMVSQYLGLAAANALRNISVDNLPVLMIITKLRGVTEVFSIIPGSVTLDELMTRLIQAVDMFNSQVSSEIEEEREREARELMKREQDAAYEASLMADRAKEEAKRLEQEEKRKRELAELQEKERQEEIRQHEEAVKLAIQESLAQQVPCEPPKDSPELTTELRMRLPNGEVLNRRFLARNVLQDLLNFLASKGYPRDEFKILTSWPRQDLSVLDPNKSLQDLKLYPQETITVEAR